MRLASFHPKGSQRIHLGAALEIEGKTALVDLQTASQEFAQPQEMPADVIRFMDGGSAQIESALRLLQHCAPRAAKAAERKRLEQRGVLYWPGEVRFLPPVPRPGKVISLGANYPTHRDEASHLPSVQQLMSGPAVPRAFAKLPSVLVGHQAPIAYPQATRQLDYEIELALIIGKRCRNISADRYGEVVYGYTIFNDLSMRDVQMAEMAAGLLLFGKNFDGAGPIGPWLVTSDEVPDPHALDLALTVNGELRQSDNTRNMMQRIPAIIEYWSQLTLEPGDIITTGTPAGVAIFRKPAERYLLRPGDRIAATISRLGTLENTIVAGTAGPPA